MMMLISGVTGGVPTSFRSVFQRGFARVTIENAGSRSAIGNHSHNSCKVWGERTRSKESWLSKTFKLFTT